jgi:hypothetical protein
MKRAFLIVLLAFVVVLLVVNGYAQNAATSDEPILQRIAVARFVYVTTYDGPTYLPQVLPEDRQAVADVERALKRWGHYTVVISPDHADLIITIQKRANEDVMAIYDARTPAASPLWWASQKGGLEGEQMPFVMKLREQVEKTLHIGPG